MPTGYTHKLYEGEQSFEDFVWSCARAFGAFVMMRDSPSDAPITESALTYGANEQRIREAEVALAEWDSASEAARRAMYESWLATEERTRRELDDKRAAVATRYDAMLSRVREWAPPSAEHVELRKFMVEQIQRAAEFDCAPYPSGPIPDFAAWCVKQAEKLARDVEYYTDRFAKDRALNESRIRWVRQLNESVPLPGGFKP